MSLNRSVFRPAKHGLVILVERGWSLVARLASGRRSIAMWSARWIELYVDAWLSGPGARIAYRATIRRIAQGKPRTLWGTTPILTLPIKARADRMLGLRSKSLVFTTYVVARKFDLNLQVPARLINKFAPRFAVAFHKVVLAFLLPRYDVFHFFFDRGVLLPDSRFGINLRELEILQAAGKRIYVYAYGADVRLREKTLALGRWNFCVDCPEPGRFCVCDDQSGSKMIEGITRRATATIALGDMISYLPGCRNIHYWPIDIENITPGGSPRNDGPLRIAHAPNHTHFKGSHYLEDAIQELQREGYAIEYVKVQGVPNAAVIRLFENADIVADQFIGGAYGYTALEAMARGKPVMTYVRSKELVEAPEDCPLVNATPDTLLPTLKWLVSNRSRLHRIGAQGRVYVEKWHSIGAVAERLGALYEATGEFSPETLRRFNAHSARQAAFRASLPNVVGWEHPFQISGRSL